MVEANFQAACGAPLDDSQNRRNGGCFLTRNTTVEVENGWASFSHYNGSFLAMPKSIAQFNVATENLLYLFDTYSHLSSCPVKNGDFLLPCLATGQDMPGSRMKLTVTQGQCLQPSYLLCISHQNHLTSGHLIKPHPFVLAYTSRSFSSFNVLQQQITQPDRRDGDCAH